MSTHEPPRRRLLDLPDAARKTFDVPDLLLGVLLAVVLVSALAGWLTGWPGWADVIIIVALAGGVLAWCAVTIRWVNRSIRVNTGFQAAMREAGGFDKLTPAEQEHWARQLEGLLQPRKRTS
jgi:hypothetical protein